MHSLICNAIHHTFSSKLLAMVTVADCAILHLSKKYKHDVHANNVCAYTRVTGLEETYIIIYQVRRESEKRCWYPAWFGVLK